MGDGGRRLAQFLQPAREGDKTEQKMRARAPTGRTARIPGAAGLPAALSTAARSYIDNSHRARTRPQSRPPRPRATCGVWRLIWRAWTIDPTAARSSLAGPSGALRRARARRLELGGFGASSEQGLRRRLARTRRPSAAAGVTAAGAAGSGGRGGSGLGLGGRGDRSLRGRDCSASSIASMAWDTGSEALFCCAISSASYSRPASRTRRRGAY